DPRELEQRIVLAYTGEPRQSGTNNWEIIKRHVDGDRDIFDCFERIRDTVAAMRAALERGDWDEVGRQIAAEWNNRKRLAPGVMTDHLQLKNANPFKMRAYRNGADIAANHPHHPPSLDEAGLREIPGIGKDLAGKIREIADTGGAAFHRELLAEFPPTILDLLHLHGVGPKTLSP